MWHLGIHLCGAAILTRSLQSQRFLVSHSDVHERLSRLVFSGEFKTGSSLVERDLAERLGVSRVPVRESLSRLVAQGALEGGRKGEGVRIRRYSADEIRQLYDYRAVIEGGIAHSAAGSASKADLFRLTLICDEMEGAIDDDSSSRWGSLDSKFHEALAEAGHNDRFERSVKNLLQECSYVFYDVARRGSRRELSTEEFATHKRQALDDHREIIQLVQAHDADGAEARMRWHILRSAGRVIRTFVETDLGG
jgi:DNA-binding GntR family transcriptional regulator